MNIVISGASRGIGAACVRAFAKRGDSVAFIYKNSSKLAQMLANETGAKAIKADLAIREECIRAINEAQSMLGSIDVLVNNVGVSSIGLFTDVTQEEYERVMKTNLDSAVLCSQEALHGMISQKSGSIINISSMWGEVGASCEVIYSTAKSALIGFTKALAKEVGPSNIRVNCITPGVIDTDMNCELTDEAIAELSNETPLCRIGKASEVADAVLFLAGPQSSFITGAVLPVNGGIIM